ncbi:hypothetical protein [Paenibacillus taiwanensis]|uniref:hypothetical protein n=1 Tax=Paenibacillus taiwanensis TaxID=401638 RepID=UPI000428101C|nr:hypothetical protein [Paenibacillus taiwanensis]
MKVNDFMSEFSFKSENTLNFVSLHDCVIEEVSIEDKNLIVWLEHIDVLSVHPFNHTGFSMYTGKSKVRFIDYEIIESILYDTSQIKGMKHIIVEEAAQKRVMLESELLLDFEILKNEELQAAEDYFVHRFDGSASLKYNADFGYCIIKYKKIIIEWNEFIDKAWFEDR